VLLERACELAVQRTLRLGSALVEHAVGDGEQEQRDEPGFDPACGQRGAAAQAGSELVGEEQRERGFEVHRHARHDLGHAEGGERGDPDPAEQDPTAPALRTRQLRGRDQSGDPECEEPVFLQQVGEVSEPVLEQVPAERERVRGMHRGLRDHSESQAEVGHEQHGLGRDSKRRVTHAIRECPLRSSEGQQREHTRE
jgi:hypothetical protein